MLEIKQFRYAADNLAYLVYGKKKALAIDGGATEEILSFLENRRLELLYVANTHDHYDHTSGNDELLRRTKAVLVRKETFPDGGIIEREVMPIRIMHTPGHTQDSVCFYTGKALISGDTIFNGTIGNCFSGDLCAFYQSIKKIMLLPEDTIIYAGHDYVRDSMFFAQLLEPGNLDIDLFLGQYNPEHLFSTLVEECKINPYLRFNDPKIIALLKQKGLPVGTEWECWQSLMSIE